MTIAKERWSMTAFLLLLLATAPRLLHRHMSQEPMETSSGVKPSQAEACCDERHVDLKYEVAFLEDTQAYR